MHDDWQSLIPDYITDELPEVQRSELEKHLKTCSECRQALDDWRAIAKVTKAKAKARSRPLPPLLDILNGIGTAPLTKEQRIEEEIEMSINMIPQPYDRRRFSLPMIAAIVVAILFVGILLGKPVVPSNIQLGQGQSLSNIPEDPVALFELYIEEIWNNQNLEAIPLLLSEDHVHHDAALQEDIVGLEAIAEYVVFEHDILPDVTFTAESLAANGNDVIGRMTMTYEEFTKTVLVNATIADGKLAEIWFDVGMIHLFIEEENMRIAELWIERVWNLTDVPIEDYEELAHSPYTFHDANSFGVYQKRPTSLLEWNSILHQVYPDVNVTIEYIVADSNMVVLYGSFVGTHEGYCSFCDFKKESTGEVRYSEVTFIFRFEDGKIVEDWWFWEWDTMNGDLLAAAAAIGVINTQEQNSAIAQRIIDEIWNAEEIDAAVFEELYLPNMRYGYNTSRIASRVEQASLVELHNAIRQAFPDARLTVMNRAVNDSAISIPFIWTGTHTGTFEYQDIVLPPSNEVVTVDGVLILTITSQGLVAIETWYVDFPFLAEFEQIVSD